jgi:hypothetical protein
MICIGVPLKDGRAVRGVELLIGSIDFPELPYGRPILRFFFAIVRAMLKKA